MYEIILNGVFVLIAVSLVFSIYYSIKYRRQQQPVSRGIYQAKQNIAMGTMLVLLSIYLLYLMPGTNMRITIGVLFLLIGLFNLFAGFRNQSFYRSKQD